MSDNTNFRPLEDVLRELNPNIDKAMAGVAQLVAASVQEELSRPGTGRLYPRGEEQQHRASAPGEPPAPDTGTLRGSVGVDRIGPTRYTVSVHSTYAAFLEFGTTRMAPRPFMLRAVARVQRALGTDLGVSGVLRIFKKSK